MISTRSFVSVFSLFCFCTLSAAPALAQNAEPDENSNEIIVEGYTEKEVRQFLWRSLVETDDRIALRTEPVCFAIDNIADIVAQPVSQRIESNLTAAGIAVGEEGCDANAVVVFHRDPQRFVKEAEEEYPLLFRTMYKPEQRRLTRPERPVYSWMFIPSEFRVLAASVRELIPLTTGFDPATTSRIQQLPPAGISHSFTIADLDKLDGMTTTQLADYLTLQMVIEFRPGEFENAPADSILNLFHVDDPEQDAPAEMSPMDREMLEQLYDPSRRFVSAGAARAGMAINMIANLDEEGLITR